MVNNRTLLNDVLKARTELEQIEAPYREAKASLDRAEQALFGRMGTTTSVAKNAKGGVPCPINPKHGKYSRLGHHMKAIHPDEYHPGWSNAEYLA